MLIYISLLDKFIGHKMQVLIIRLTSLFIECANIQAACMSSKIPILRPPFGLPKSGLISEVVLITNTISLGKYHLGLAKIGLNSGVVLIARFYCMSVLVILNIQGIMYLCLQVTSVTLVT